MTGPRNKRAQPDEVRKRLEKRREALAAKLTKLTERPDLGTAQGFGKRVGDGTIEAVRRLTDIGVGNSTEIALTRTERALAKLEEGTYGACDSCGTAISSDRLQALPDSVYCLDCASRQPPPRPRGRRSG